jgi:hypothetical protein
MRSLLLLFFISICFTQSYKAQKRQHNLTFDGLVENNWEAYTKITNFYQRWPNFGAKSQVKSEVFFTYDEENVYFAGRFYQEKASVKGTRYRRDNMEMWSEDWFQLNFDPFNQGTSGFYLGLNPANALIDGKLGPNGQEDESWDGIIFTKTHIHDDHWSFEIKIPLSSIDFQNKDTQDWKITFGRSHSGLQEQSWAHQMNKDDQIRITSYMTFTDLKNLRIAEPYKITPYFYSDVLNDELADESFNDQKGGIEVQYQANPATKFLATVNPDFAQLESDAEVINVSDNPTQFREKRPFFTSNSDFYGISPAVRTRNIGEIDFGTKFIQDFGKIKYDLGYIRDGSDANWLLGHFIYNDSKFLKMQLVGGLYKHEERSYANAVVNTELSFYDRQMTFFNYLEYNNVVDHELGTLTGLSYRERSYNWSINYDLKPQGYNTSAVGWFLTSNKADLSADYWYNHYIDANEGFLRRIGAGFQIERNSLHSHMSEAWYEFEFATNMEFIVWPSLGRWDAWFEYAPAMKKKNRVRSDTGKYEDSNFFAGNRFDLIEAKHDNFGVGIGTDESRMFSGRLGFNKQDVRQANGKFIDARVKMKATESLQIEYSIQYADINPSQYQSAVTETLHRVKASYSFTDKLNTRIIYSLSDSKLPNSIELDKDEVPTGIVGYSEEAPVLNFTSSWEYAPGSFAYFVFNRARFAEGFSSLKDTEKFNSFIFKVNKSFQF